VCGVFADRKDFHFIPTRGKLINEVYQFVQGSHSAIPKKTDCTWKKNIGLQEKNRIVNLQKNILIQIYDVKQCSKY